MQMSLTSSSCPTLGQQLSPSARLVVSLGGQVNGKAKYCPAVKKKKKVSLRPVSTQVRAGGGAGGAAGVGAEIPQQTLGRPWQSKEVCEEEGRAKSCHGLTRIPTPHPPVPLGKEVEDSGWKEGS